MGLGNAFPYPSKIYGNCSSTATIILIYADSHDIDFAYSLVSLGSKCMRGGCVRVKSILAATALLEIQCSGINTHSRSRGDEEYIECEYSVIARVSCAADQQNYTLLCQTANNKCCSLHERANIH